MQIGRARRLIVAALIAPALALLAPASPAATGSAMVTGTNTAITAGWRSAPAGQEFFTRCVQSQAIGGSALPTSNGVGAYVIDMGSPRLGNVSISSPLPVTNLGPPIPDPTKVIFPSGSMQLHNYDFDLYFISEQCSQVGSVVTQNATEAGPIPTPARYVVILLAFNATGNASVPVTYTTP